MMVRAHALTKRYGAVTALDDLSFEVETGETFALVGPNGAGKTTALRILLGLARPDSGNVAVGRNALPPHDPAARRDLGYVPQRVEFPPGRTVTEVLRFFADLRGLPAAAVPRTLERVGLGSVTGRRANELSGGYTQRLSLAQALLADPALLVLDEPTASLDPEATWEFRSLVLALRREGKTILLCSHLLAEVERVADRVLILVEGRCAALERLDALRERQARDARLALGLAGDPGPAMRALARAGFAAEPLDGVGVTVEAAGEQALDAIEAVRAAGIRVRGFEVRRPTLEESFLAAVRTGRRDA